MKNRIYSLATATLLVIGAAPAAHASSIYISVGGLYLGGAPTNITYLPAQPHQIQNAVTLDFPALNSWLVTTTGAGDQSGLTAGTGFVQFDAGPESNTTLNITNPTTLWEKEWAGTYNGQAAYFTEVLTNVSGITRTSVGQLQVQLTGTLYVTSGPLDEPGSGTIFTTAPAQLLLQVQNQNGASGTWTTTFLDTAGTRSAPGPMPGVGLLGSAALLGFLLTMKMRASRG